MEATITRHVGLIDFAITLAELGAIPDLTGAQTAYLEALDGRKPEPLPAVKAELLRAAGRRYLRTLVAAHAIAHGNHATILADAAGETATLAIIDDVLSLAQTYQAAQGATGPLGDLTVRDTATGSS